MVIIRSLCHSFQFFVRRFLLLHENDGLLIIKTSILAVIRWRYVPILLNRPSSTGLLVLFSS